MDKIEFTITDNIPEEVKYAKMYTDGMDSIMNMPPYERNVMYAVIIHMTKANTLSISKKLQTELSKMFDCTERTINKGLKNLSDRNVIVKTGVRKYFVNPYIFGKAEWSKVLSLRRKFDKLIGDSSNE
jgi:uncharacterized protein YbcC (UPF0753/DUF2309 family)